MPESLIIVIRIRCAIKK